MPVSDTAESRSYKKRPAPPPQSVSLLRIRSGRNNACALLPSPAHGEGEGQAINQIAGFGEFRPLANFE